MTDEDETQGIANARETRDLVLSAMLALAVRAIEHVDAHHGEGVEFASLGEEFPGGGYTWTLAASYRYGHTFVRIAGSPENDATRAGVVSSPQELAAVMGGQSAAFDVQVPRAWIELAARAAVPEGVLR